MDTSPVQIHLAWLGMAVRDRISGVAGIVTSMTFDVGGSVRAIVSPPADDKGELPPSARGPRA